MHIYGKSCGEIREEEKISKAKVLFATFDLSAKVKALNFNQFNGKYCCSVSEQEGKCMCLLVCAAFRSHDKCFAFGVRALQKEEVHILNNFMYECVHKCMCVCIL